MLPEELLKPRPKGFDTELESKRVKKILRVQGVFSVLLAIALIASWAWFLDIGDAVTIHAIAENFNPPVRITVPLHVYAEERRLSTKDTVNDPIVTVYGQVEDFANLHEILDGFSVSVRKTEILPNPQTGEFVEKIVLHPGKNDVDISLSWDGEEKYRYSYDITYVKPQAAVEPQEDEGGAGELLIP